MGKLAKTQVILTEGGSAHNAHLILMQFFSGALYDTLGNYDAGFYFAGTMIFISGAMLFAIPVLQRKLERKKPTFDITSGKGQDEFVPDA